MAAAGGRCDLRGPSVCRPASGSGSVILVLIWYRKIKNDLHQRVVLVGLGPVSWWDFLSPGLRRNSGIRGRSAGRPRDNKRVFILGYAQVRFLSPTMVFLDEGAEDRPASPTWSGEQMMAGDEIGGRSFWARRNRMPTPAATREDPASAEKRLIADRSSVLSATATRKKTKTQTAASSS